MEGLLRKEHRVNQAIPSLLLSMCAVDPTEEGVALKMVWFSFILRDSFAAGLVAWAGSPSSPLWRCTTHPSISGGDDKSKGTWQRGNEEAGQALLLCHLICDLLYTADLRDFCLAALFCSETVK